MVLVNFSSFPRQSIISYHVGIVSYLVTPLPFFTKIETEATAIKLCSIAQEVSHMWSAPAYAVRNLEVTEHILDNLVIWNMSACMHAASLDPKIGLKNCTEPSTTLNGSMA